jgi:hypothetical protein
LGAGGVPHLVVRFGDGRTGLFLSVSVVAGESLSRAGTKKPDPKRPGFLIF